MTQSLTRRVAQAVVRMGSATAADLAPQFPDCTVRQIVDALHHAKEARLISMVTKGKNLGYRNGKTLSTYGKYVPAPQLQRVASVWDLGSRFAAQA